MAIKKSDLLPKPPPPPPDRNQQIQEFRRRVEKFIDMNLKEGKRVIPICTLPKALAVWKLTDNEANTLQESIIETYRSAEWAIDKVTTEHNDYGQWRTVSAWEFS